MKKKLGVFLCLILSVFFLVPNFTHIVHAGDEGLYVGGMPAGFSLFTKGAEVVGVCDVITENGIVSPCKDAEILVGDYILSINDNTISKISDIENSIEGQTEVIIIILRNNERITKTIKPAKDITGKYKLGVFIRDSVSGIGTITYIKGDRFASLGHPVLNDDGAVLDVVGGNLYSCNITGCIKGERGRAGELRGVFVKNTLIARIDKNLTCGVFGSISENFNRDNLLKVELGQAVPGDACIYSTVEGLTPSEYKISIIKADNYGENKNFVIRVTDKNLLETTGGIVQGMSGSPILQNGKLVGAVTHVFINDPTRGFGIDIDNMINN